jgi:hypothetical protein
MKSHEYLALACYLPIAGNLQTPHLRSETSVLKMEARSFSETTVTLRVATRWKIPKAGSKLTISYNATFEVVITNE